ncbi:MAG: lactoylglutathione lyase [Zoogloeaceae bacterium]|jgi:lactoylglutathione lyase|nr:lactoylglutathione lyase [Zoogloeaceae bacterium]
MRILHTMIRVGDLDRSIAFYTEVLGMTLLRRQDYPNGRFTLAFIGYGPESENAVIELTHNWGKAHYEQGTAFGHIAIEVEDARKTCDAIRAKGGKILFDAAPMTFDASIIIAFIEDPDGYSIELIQAAR